MTLYDLTHPIEAGLPVYPGDPPVALDAHATHERDGYRVTALSMGTHAGTHVDAPSHTEADGRTLGEFPVETFRFDARRVDLRGLDPRAVVGPGDLPATDADLLAIETGWDDHWGAASYRDHPYLSPDAAQWCADHGHHVGIDACSVDPSPGERASDDEPSGHPAHHALLCADRLILENLTGLDALPARFTLHAHPLAVDADGAPVRAVAEVE